MLTKTQKHNRKKNLAREAEYGVIMEFTYTCRRCGRQHKTKAHNPAPNRICDRCGEVTSPRR